MGNAAMAAWMIPASTERGAQDLETEAGVGAVAVEEMFAVDEDPPAFADEERHRIGHHGHRFVEGDVGQLVLRGQAPGVRPALEIRSELAVEGHHVLAALGILPHRARNAQELERLLEGEGARVHGREERRRARLRPAVDHLAQLHVGTEAPGLDLDVQPGLGVDPEHPVVGGCGQQLLGPGHGQLVGCHVVGQ